MGEWADSEGEWGYGLRSGNARKAGGEVDMALARKLIIALITHQKDLIIGISHCKYF